MKRIFSILAALTLALGMLSSCGDYDYEEPAFYDDTIEWTISALGGQFLVQYKYVWYETKNITRKFDFVYRLIIDGVATEALEPDDVHSEYDPEMTYSGDMLKEMLSLNECFTNRAAACFLMPGFLVARVLKRHNNQKKVVIYNNGILAQDQKLLIQKMADTLGVSYTAFYHRLGELDLYDRRPVEEYLHSGLCYGGEACAGSN